MNPKYISVDSNPLKNQHVFMTACGQTVDSFNMAQIKLYMTLCIEEMQETVDALKAIETNLAEAKPLHRADVAELIDGAADVMVVAGGLLASIGVDTVAVMVEIWRSNLAKIQPDGMVAKREDGKVLIKPAGWEPPNLLPFADKVLGIK